MGKVSKIGNSKCAEDVAIFITKVIIVEEEIIRSSRLLFNNYPQIDWSLCSISEFILVITDSLEPKHLVST